MLGNRADCTDQDESRDGERSLGLAMNRVKIFELHSSSLCKTKEF
jgi:hypothetical protein